MSIWTRRNLLSHAIPTIIVGSLRSDALARPENRVGHSTIDVDGTIHAREFEVPFSSYLSETSKRILADSLLNPPSWNQDNTDIHKSRKSFDEHMMSPLLGRVEALHSTTIEKGQVGGVSTYLVTPEKRGDSWKQRILINLHGGAFTYGSGMGQLIESIPVSSVSGLQVLSIDYRQGPEHTFPAASEDVAAVYKALLKTYKPENIGVYGCSAGGILTAMTMAWLDKEKLPLPGAIGIFCAGAEGLWGGESRYTSPILMGQNPPPAAPNPPPFPMTYLKDADLKDPLVSPLISPALLRKFPETMLITGTRAYEMSSVLHTHIQLIKAGVGAQLYVWEGMPHGFIYTADLPESKEAYDLIGKFFNRSLGHLPSQV